MHICLECIQTAKKISMTQQISKFQHNLKLNFQFQWQKLQVQRLYYMLQLHKVIYLIWCVKLNIHKDSSLFKYVWWKAKIALEANVSYLGSSMRNETLALCCSNLKFDPLKRVLSRESDCVDSLCWIAVEDEALEIHQARQNVTWHCTRNIPRMFVGSMTNYQWPFTLTTSHAAIKTSHETDTMQTSVP